MSIEALKAALAAGPTTALYADTRDSEPWCKNEAFARACDPDTIRALLKDAERWRYAREHMLWAPSGPGEYKLMLFLKMEAEPDSAPSPNVPRAYDAAIDAAMGEQA